MSREELKQHAERWAREVIEKATESPQEATEQILFPGSSGAWERVSPEMFQQPVQQARIYWSTSIIEFAKSLPSYSDLEAGLLADPILGPQLNTLVGTAFGASLHEPYAVAFELLPDPAEFLNGEPYNFDVRWKKALYIFEVDMLPYSAMLVIGGLDLQGTTIVLDDSCTLEPMSDHDIGLALQYDILRRPFPSMPFFNGSTDSFAALKLSRDLPKVIGDLSEPGVQELANKAWLDTQEVFEVVEHCLGLLTEKVHILGQLSQSDTGGTSYAPRPAAPRIFGAAETLDASKVDELKLAWSVLRDEKFAQNRAFRLAVRRVSYSHERTRLEDRLLDLLIAAEAFYVDGAYSELGFRLAVHAAVWNSVEGWTRLEVKRLFSNAYSVRSAIAHGDEPKKENLRVKGEQIELDEFARTVEILLKAGLTKALVAANDHPKKRVQIDWSALVLGK